jgi:hypothetical protein
VSRGESSRDGIAARVGPTRAAEPDVGGLRWLRPNDAVDGVA